MSDRPCDASLPLCRIGTERLRRAIDICQLEHTAEGAFLPVHADLSCWRDNLICPPTGCHLDREHILVLTEQLCNIVGERAASLLPMCKTRLQQVAANETTIHIEIINTECRRHPACTLHRLLSLQREQEPTGSVSGTTPIPDGVSHNGSIRHRNPFTLCPNAVGKCLNALDALFLCGTSACHYCQYRQD